MLEKLKLRSASFLYSNFFSVYRMMYFKYKSRHDNSYLKLFQHLVKPGFTILDIGANIGFYTVTFSELTGKHGHVHAFEPDTKNFHHLGKEVEGLRNVTVVPKAVSSESGTLLLYKSPLINVDHRTYEYGSKVDKYVVEKISFDDYAGDRFSVDLIKLDIQGYEMEALKGMRHTLTGNQHVLVFMELWQHGLLKAGASALHVYDFLSDLGFNIYEVNSTVQPLTREKVSLFKNDFFSDTHILASRNKIRLNVEEN